MAQSESKQDSKDAVYREAFSRLDQRYRPKESHSTHVAGRQKEMELLLQCWNSRVSTSSQRAEKGSTHGNLGEHSDQEEEIAVARSTRARKRQRLSSRGMATRGDASSRNSEPEGSKGGQNPSATTSTPALGVKRAEDSQGTEPLASGALNQVIYISGQPGTGKTMCVEVLISHLYSLSSDGTDASISVSPGKEGHHKGRVLPSITPFHTHLLPNAGCSVTWINCNALGKRGALKNVFSAAERATEDDNLVIFLVLDEIDALLNRSPDETQEQLTAIMNPECSVPYFIIGIANTPKVDHPALPYNVQRIAFRPYEWTNIVDILSQRVGDLHFDSGMPVFDAMALERCARDVAKNKGGDVRKGLVICREALTLVWDAFRQEQEEEAKKLVAPAGSDATDKEVVLSSVSVRHVAACLDVSKAIREILLRLTMQQKLLVSLIAQKSAAEEGNDTEARVRSPSPNGVSEAHIFPLYKQLCDRRQLPTMPLDDVRDALSVIDSRIISVSNRASTPRPFQTTPPKAVKLPRWAGSGKRGFGGGLGRSTTPSFQASYSGSERHFTLAIPRHELTATMSIDPLWQRLSLNDK